MDPSEINQSINQTNRKREAEDKPRRGDREDPGA